MNARAALLVSLVLALPACGGGGGGSPGGAALLQGTYGLHAFEGLTSVPFRHAFWGVRSADGAGEFPSSGVMRNDGSTAIPFPTEPRRYEMQGSDLIVRDKFDVIDAKGGLSADGALAGWVTTAGTPALELLARTSSGRSAASLSGRFQFALFGQEVARSFTLTAEVDFDGAGRAQFNGFYYSTALGTSPTSPGTYTLADDGSFTLVLDTEDVTLAGQLDPSGNVLTLSGSVENGSPRTFVGAAVREPTSASSATFAGTYAALQIGEDGGYRVGCSEIVADGGSTLAVGETTINDEGTPSTFPSTLQVYGVDPGGSILIGETLFHTQGFVSPDGRLAILYPFFDQGTPPFVTVLIRK